MAIICPTVTAESVDEYIDQMDLVSSFAPRIHVDLGDGVFTTKLVDIETVAWPQSVVADVHLMYDEPLNVLDQLIARRPSLVILHAESQGELKVAIDKLHTNGIRAGVALLQKTSVKTIAAVLPDLDHVMIFSGSLGSFGGKVDPSLFQKIVDVRGVKPEIEIGWDGGAGLENVSMLADSGVDVINVGGGIHRANHPRNAYRAMSRLVSDR